MELAAGGWPLWQGQFTPFGAELPDGSTAMHYKFTGKERDNESGLDYFGARYYASNFGRWMSPDWSAKEEPVPYAKLDDPQSLNLYAYVQNSPLSRIDADGHEQVQDLFNNYRGPGFISPQQRPTTSDSINVSGKSHWWQRAGHWFGGTSLAIGFARFGRLGGPAHRQAIDAASRMLRDEGYSVSTEKYVKTPNGAKSGRFIDVYGTKDGAPDRAIQIGLTNSDNITPVAREVSAMNDIENVIGMRPQFLDYQSPYPIGEIPIPGWPVQPPPMFGSMPAIKIDEDVIP